jgi:hypothetical protein
MRDEAEQVCPAILDAGIDQERQCALEIGIGKDDLRRFSAQFQRHRNDVLRRRLLDLAAGFERTGERDMIDAGMRAERRTGFLAKARHNVERACRQAAVHGDAGEGQGRQRGFLSRLQNRGVAHGQAAPTERPRICIG